jgi:hypothetical protein
VTKDKGEPPLARIYDWMLRRRLLREPQWGQPSFAQRLLRIRLLSALSLALPALVLCAWYALIALSAHEGHQAELNVREPLTAAIFHLHLHDRLVRDWQRLVMPEPQRKSLLPTLGLALDADKLDALDRRLPPDDGLAYYVDGLLIRNNRAHEVQVRYRGGKYWHYRHPQKSWKVRAKDGKSIGGYETFSLINTPEAIPFEEDIILDIAREQGLLTPEYFPMRLLLNKDYMGVYFFEAQPDAGLLRRAGRAPGSVYSGSEAPIDPETGVSTLFRSADHFSKVAQGIHQQLGERNELNALVRAVNDSTPAEFTGYATRHLDLDKFATFDALDVTFGCNQHDFADNHKLYFDPYRDKFEPIAWNFRGCKHAPEFNRTENPLLLRMKQVPGYLTRRNRIVYRLLRGTAAPEALRERMHTFLDKLQPDQARDPYWDANQLLPAMGPYYAQLLRPLDRELEEVVIETRLYDLHKRNHFLVGRLENQVPSARFQPFSPPVGNDQKPTDRGVSVGALDVVVSGETGFRLVRVEPRWAAECRPEYWQLFADTTLDDRLEPGSDDILGDGKIRASFAEPSLDLDPGVRFEARRVHATRGGIRAVRDARRYRMFLRAPGCGLAGATLDFENLVTGARTRAIAAQGLSDALPTGNACAERYREEPGYVSPHPWCLPAARAELINLGPGAMDIRHTTVFHAHQSVVIAPGTTLRMGGGASLVFYGHLDASGTAELPIRIEPAEQVWGGVVLQGQATQDSRLSHVTFVGGSHPSPEGALWRGVVNIHDSRRVMVDHCAVESPRAEVGFHIASVQDLDWHHSRISNTSGNAIELMYSTAALDHLTVTNSGRGALVCSGSRAVLQNSRIVGAGDCAVSAGQVATLTVRDSLIANAECGLHAHEAATIEQERVLLYRDALGARLESNSDGFPTKAHLKGALLYAVECKVPFEGEPKRQKSEQQVITQVAGADLELLRTQVLQIQSWGALDQSIAGLITGAVR